MNWETQRDDFLNALNTLFAQIQEWLQPLANQGLVTFATSQVLLNEMHIGRYHAPLLIIQSGGQAVHFEPVWTEIIGASGRVDMKPISRLPYSGFLSQPCTHGSPRYLRRGLLAPPRRQYRTGRRLPTGPGK